MNRPKINDKVLKEAANEGIDRFITLILDAYKEQMGETLSAEALQQYTPDQITLWGYAVLHEEVMDGGFIQLIYNGYGPFFFDNPFAKALRLWGLHDLSKLIYKVKKLYDEQKKELTRERTDDDFMALFEEHPEFDALDDLFVEREEEFTRSIAIYVDDHLADFIEVLHD